MILKMPKWQTCTRQIKKLYEHTAKQWVQNYALETPDDSKVKQLMEMGFPKDQAQAALERCDFNEQRAVQHLLGGE